MLYKTGPVRGQGPLLAALERPSAISIPDMDLFLFEDAADFGCKLVEQHPNCFVIQVAGIERQHFTGKDCYWFTGHCQVEALQQDWVESGPVSCRDGRGAPLRCRF